MVKLVLSVGHNPKTRGARTEIGGDEYSRNHRLVMALSNLLDREGIRHLLVPPELPLVQKIEWVLRNAPQAIALEIHHNVFNGRASGSEVFYGVGDRIGFLWGQKLLGSVCETIGLKNRGMKLAAMSARGSLAWTNKLPHGLIYEVGFMDNPEDLTRLEQWPLAALRAIVEDEVHPN